MKLRLTLAFLAALHACVLFIDAAGRFHPRPFVFAVTQTELGGDFRQDPERLYPIHFLVRGRLFGVAAPGVLFLCGSDGFGRDVFSRVLYGGQVSVLTGLVAAFLSLTLGLLSGTLAGFYGGWLDRLLMRGGELFLALPWLYLLLAVRAFLPLHISTTQAFFLLVAIIGTVGWVRPARMVRGVVLSARERPFVLAARGFGASGLYLIRRHILPLTWSVVLTQATVLIPRY